MRNAQSLALGTLLLMVIFLVIYCCYKWQMMILHLVGLHEAL